MLLTRMMRDFSRTDVMSVSENATIVVSQEDLGEPTILRDPSGRFPDTILVLCLPDGEDIDPDSNVVGC